MVDTYLSTKIGVSSLDGFWRILRTDDDDGCLRHGISSADTVKQS